MSRPTASVIVPALNEEGNVADLVAEIRAAVAARDWPVEVVEVVIVDNGSTDATAARAAAAGARVVGEPTAGYGRACLAGALAASGEILVFMDGDRSEVPAEMPQVLAPLLAGECDLTVGSRVLGHAEPGALSPQQLAGNWVAARLLGLLYGVKATDLGPYRAIRRADLLALGMTEMTYGWPTEMIARSARAGLRVLEVPVTCRRRTSGVSKVSGNLEASAKAGWRIMRTIVRCRVGGQASLRGGSIDDTRRSAGGERP